MLRSLLGTKDQLHLVTTHFPNNLNMLHFQICACLVVMTLIIGVA